MCKWWKCWATLCVHTCAGRKGNTLYESTVPQREDSVYMQIRVVLVLRSNVGGARGALWEVQRGCTRRYQSWCDGLEALKDWLTEYYCWGLRATVCVAATTLCVTERDNQEVQDTLASEEQYKQRTQLGVSKEQEVVRAEAGQGWEERVIQKGPEVPRPSYQVVAFASRRKPQEQQAVC